MNIKTTLAVLTAAVTLAATTPMAQADPTRILVIPFTALNVPDSQQYLARAPVETIVADLGRAGPNGSVSPIAFQGQLIVEDNATAARLAREVNATYAIRGSVQSSGDTIRLTAQLIDAHSGDTLNTASVTGPVADVLKLEDQLSTDIRGIPAANGGPTPGTPPVAPIAPATPAAPVAPQIVVMPPAPAPDYYPYNSSDYSPYSSFDSSYPYGLGFYPGFSTIVITNRDHRHDRDHNGDGHHEGGNTGVANPGVASSGLNGNPLVPLSPAGGVVPLAPRGGVTPNAPVGGLIPTFAMPSAPAPMLRNEVPSSGPRIIAPQAAPQLRLGVLPSGPSGSTFHGNATAMAPSFQQTAPASGGGGGRFMGRGR